MSTHTMTLSARLPIVVALSLGALAAQAQDKVLNIYSARHYQTDEVMYDTFTKTTGIKINRVDADDAGIVARLKAEGAASPADVVLLVGAARMVSADSQGLFQPIKSAKLDAAIPAHLRADASKDGVTWTGFSTRARVIVYDPLRVKAADVANYEQLADPKLKGLVCTRSGSHPYNLSLFATVVERLGDTFRTRLELADLTASTRMASRLESRLGVRLLQRTTRRLSLTPQGEVYVAHCQELLALARSANLFVRFAASDEVKEMRIPAKLNSHSGQREHPDP